MSAVELKFSIGEQNGTLKFGNAKTCKPEHMQGLARFCVTDLAKMFGGNREKAVAAVLGRRCKLASDRAALLSAPEAIGGLLVSANAAIASGDRESAKRAVVALGAEALRWLEEIEELA